MKRNYKHSKYVNRQATIPAKSIKLASLAMCATKRYLINECIMSSVSPSAPKTAEVTPNYDQKKKKKKKEKKKKGKSLLKM